MIEPPLLIDVIVTGIEPGRCKLVRRVIILVPLRVSPVYGYVDGSECIFRSWNLFVVCIGQPLTASLSTIRHFQFPGFHIAQCVTPW